jgi:hypothetical protein
MCFRSFSVYSRIAALAAGVAMAFSATSRAQQVAPPALNPEAKLPRAPDAMRPDRNLKLAEAERNRNRARVLLDDAKKRMDLIKTQLRDGKIGQSEVTRETEEIDRLLDKAERLLADNQKILAELQKMAPVPTLPPPPSAPVPGTSSGHAKST